MVQQQESHLITNIDTDKQPIVRPRPVSYDMCARLNALINPRWSSIRVYIKTDETVYYAKVNSVVPSTEPGCVIVDCETVLNGRLHLLVGAGHPFDLRLQV